MNTTSVRELLQGHYENTRRNDEFEPAWVHPFFAPVLSGAPLTTDHAAVAQAILGDKVTHEDFFGQPRIVDRDGWKVGTTTWIFLRRKHCM